MYTGKRMNRLQKFIDNPWKLFSYLAAKGCFNWMPDEVYLKCLYRSVMRKWPDLKHPRTFNEKLQWLKLHDRNPLYTTMVDKYEAKKYVSSIIGEEYIIPTYGVWESFDDIDFNTLPDQFVLKCTHDCGGLVICKDKSALDIPAAKKKIERCLKRNYYYWGREWPYKNVKPRIIAEKYMEDENKKLIDYKVLCFNGYAKIIEVHNNRFTDNHSQDFYDINWNKTFFEQNDIKNSNIYIKRPVILEDMIKLSEILSKNIIHIRVDWYYVKGKLYFGELTFYDSSGFSSFIKNQDIEIGSLIKLSRVLTH